MGIDLPCPAFPALTATNHEVTSPASRVYNCIAWAAGETGKIWWPDVTDPQRVYWPEAAPCEATVEAFVAAFGTIGYAPCPDGGVEPRFEKIALYAPEGDPTHAARQLPDGRWSSKLGYRQDIAHSLDALDGPVYGTVIHFLRRTR